MTPRPRLRRSASKPRWGARILPHLRSTNSSCGTAPSQHRAREIERNVLVRRRNVGKIQAGADAVQQYPAAAFAWQMCKTSRSSRGESGTRDSVVERSEERVTEPQTHQSKC